MEPKDLLDQQFESFTTDGEGGRRLTSLRDFLGYCYDDGQFNISWVFQDREMVPLFTALADHLGKKPSDKKLLENKVANLCVYMASTNPDHDSQAITLDMRDAMHTVLGRDTIKATIDETHSELVNAIVYKYSRIRKVSDRFEAFLSDMQAQVPADHPLKTYKSNAVDPAPFRELMNEPEEQQAKVDGKGVRDAIAPIIDKLLQDGSRGMKTTLTSMEVAKLSYYVGEIIDRAQHRVELEEQVARSPDTGLAAERRAFGNFFKAAMSTQTAAATGQKFMDLQNSAPQTTGHGREYELAHFDLDGWTAVQSALQELKLAIDDPTRKK